MPVLSYFLIVGGVLFTILTFVSSEIDPNISAIQVSQMVGIPTPYKAPSGESSLSALTNYNNAATKRWTP
jgi:hypothetical protein